MTSVQDITEVGPLFIPNPVDSKLDVCRDHLHHGALTVEGREQLLAGKRICDKASISFRSISHPPFSPLLISYVCVLMSFAEET
jgi:hypothetical protein